MNHWLEAVARRIRNGAKVYLCPASPETVLVAKMLNGKYSCSPFGFCDNDVKKQGKRLNSIGDSTIYSFDEAARDENSEFFVVSPFHSAEIIGNLFYERNIPETRIINFQPIEQKTTCARFAQNWIIEDKKLVCCCIEEYKPRFDNQGLDPKNGIEYIDRTRNDLIDGKTELPKGCRTCFNYKPSYIYKSRKLNSFNFSFRGWCNYKCEYCSANHPDLKGYNAGFSLNEYLIELEERGISNDIFSVLYAVGEPTLNDKRFPLYEHCEEKQYFLDIFSNGSFFDERLFDVAHNSPVIIRKSFDAGTAETYRKIKGVNFYSKVIKNVKKYLTAPYLVLNPKYLFVPGINDDETNVRNFVELCVELNVDFVTPVFSFLDSKYPDSDNAKKMFNLLVTELAGNGIFTANVDTLYSESYHNLYVKSFGNGE
jgi:sulfatase maturation enzyme AslB (radical SAM superfamily)